MGINIFKSNNVCDVFTRKSIRYYLHHDIYDTPLLEKSKEKKLASRLCCYNYILIPSFKNLNIFNDLFYKSKKKTIIEILGEYPRLSYFEKIKRNIKINSNREIRVIIALSGFLRYS